MLTQLLISGQIKDDDLVSLFLELSFISVQKGKKTIKVKHQNKGVFLVKTKNAFLPVKRVYSVNTYS